MTTTQKLIDSGLKLFKQAAEGPWDWMWNTPIDTAPKLFPQSDFEKAVNKRMQPDNKYVRMTPAWEARVRGAGEALTDPDTYGSAISDTWKLWTRPIEGVLQHLTAMYGAPNLSKALEEQRAEKFRKISPEMRNSPMQYATDPELYMDFAADNQDARLTDGYPGIGQALRLVNWYNSPEGRLAFRNSRERAWRPVPVQPMTPEIAADVRKNPSRMFAGAMGEVIAPTSALMGAVGQEWGQQTFANDMAALHDASEKDIRNAKNYYNLGMTEPETGPDSDVLHANRFNDSQIRYLDKISPRQARFANASLATGQEAASILPEMAVGGSMPLFGHAAMKPGVLPFLWNRGVPTALTGLDAARLAEAGSSAYDVPQEQTIRPMLPNNAKKQPQAPLKVRGSGYMNKQPKLEVGDPFAENPYTINGLPVEFGPRASR